MALKTLIQCEHIIVQEAKFSCTPDAQHTHLLWMSPKLESRTFEKKVSLTHAPVQVFHFESV